MENTDQADLAAAWQAGFNTGQAVHGGSWESWMELWSSNKIRGLHLYSYFGSRS